MDDRWLRLVDELGAEPAHGPGHRLPYTHCDELGRGTYGPDLGTLTTVVLFEGQVIDAVRRPASGSGYEDVVIDLQHLRPTQRERVVHLPAPPVYATMLEWLQGLVGSAEALAGLNGAALPDESLDLDAVPASHRAVVAAIDGDLSGRDAISWMGPEFQTACRRTVVRLLDTSPSAMLPSIRPVNAAAALANVVAKANDLVGPQCVYSATDLASIFGLRSPQSDRAARWASVLGGRSWTRPERPAGCPDLLVLGTPDLLLGGFRRRLIAYRDRALQLRAGEAG